MRALLTRIYEHNVLKNAAALAYYMLFALFPLLIFASNLLGVLQLDISSVIRTLTGVLPNQVVAIAEGYLEYTTSNSSHTMLWFSLVFSVWFPTRAARGLMEDVRRAYGLGRPQRPFLYAVKQFAYTLILLAVLALTLPLTILGENVIREFLVLVAPRLPAIWQYLRFIPVGLLMLVAIGCLYVLALEQRRSFKTLLPGIAITLCGWLVVSIGFSVYVENFANYSLLYGTMGAVVVLLVWLYLSAVILILGAEYNAVRETRHSATKAPL